MASLLRGRGVQFEVLVDEGGVIIEEGIQPFTDVPVAIIGTSEKVGVWRCQWLLPLGVGSVFDRRVGG